MKTYYEEPREARARTRRGELLHPDTILAIRRINMAAACKAAAAARKEKIRKRNLRRKRRAVVPGFSRWLGVCFGTPEVTRWLFVCGCLQRRWRASRIANVSRQSYYVQKVWNLDPSTKTTRCGRCKVSANRPDVDEAEAA